MARMADENRKDRDDHLEKTSIEEQLDRVEPRLVHRVYFGLRLAFYAVIATGILIPLLGFLLWLIISARTELSRTAATALQVLLAFLSGVLTFIAWRLITTQIIAMRESYRLSALRGWILGTIAFAVVLGVIAPLFTNVTGSGIDIVSTRQPRTAVVVWVIGQIATALLFVLKIAYLRRLADFIPDPPLVRRFAALMPLAVGLLLLTIALDTAGVLASFAAPAESEEGLSAASLASTICFATVFVLTFIFVLLYLPPLYKLGTSARTELREAEAAQNTRHDETKEADE